MARNTLKLVLALAPVAMLAACGASGTAPVRSASSAPPPVRSVPIPPTNPKPPETSGFRAAKVMSLPGLEGVIGANAASLQRQFGLARLDVWEGDARKLQFSGDACVLDIYLYPPAPGKEPTAAYLDARRASDGLDVDRAACVRALKAR
ncbi:MAG: hypothetical protein IE933_08875 [Sphingomonadales bacterium]|nr:hypothetical protein [Sphingomonadales bacterium]MBD3774309.1 hypothetical protein [Paracoccaceae bacterium]